jgi:hypothetical protein
MAHFDSLASIVTAFGSTAETSKVYSSMVPSNALNVGFLADEVTTVATEVAVSFGVASSQSVATIGSGPTNNARIFLAFTLPNVSRTIFYRQAIGGSALATISINNYSMPNGDAG